MDSMEYKIAFYVIEGRPPITETKLYCTVAPLVLFTIKLLSDMVTVIVEPVCKVAT